MQYIFNEFIYNVYRPTKNVQNVIGERIGARMYLWYIDVYQ